MKFKKLFFVALAGVMSFCLGSCSNDEELVNMSDNMNMYKKTDQVIFQTSGNATTRSGSTLTSLDKFTVNAAAENNTPYFSSTIFKYDASLGFFKSDIPYHWPLSNALSFYAISDPGTLSYDENNIPVYSYKDFSGESDIVASTVKSGTKSIPYPLKFKHITSQIKVAGGAKDHTEGLSYTIKSIKLTTSCEGSYTFDEFTGGEENWFDIDNTKTKTYSYNKGIPSEGFSITNRGGFTLDHVYWNIIPNKDGKMIFDIDYLVSQNGQIIADFTGDNHKTVTIERPELKMGHVYTYCFMFSNSTSAENEITFIVDDMKDWQTESQDEKYFDNEIDSNGHEYVDMGLPSGTYWATKNVGANSVTDGGYFFTWASVTPQSYVQEDMNYVLNWQENLDLEHDAARVIMGGEWNTPTLQQYQELEQYSTQEVSVVDGIKCIIYTSKANSNTLILPCNIGNSVSLWTKDFVYNDPYFGESWYLCEQDNYNSYGGTMRYVRNCAGVRGVIIH